MRSLRTLPFLLLVIAASLFAPSAPAQTFAQPKVIPTGNWPAAVYTADLNNDGYPDLIYIDQGATPQASTTHVLLNDGKGNFTQSAILATVGDSLAFGNFTGSGKVDIGWFTPDVLAPGNIFLRSHVAANAGNGTFTAPASMLLFTVPASFQAGYTTGAHLFASGADGFIVEDVHNNTVYAIQLYTSTSLGQSSTLSLPDGPGPVTVADLNGDGKLDFVVNGLTGSGANPLPSAQVFLNHGQPGFAPYGTPALRFSGTSGVRSLLVQDVNFDGIPDLIVEGAQGHIDVFPGNGDGTFQPTSIGGTGPLDGTTGNGGRLIVAADLNNDGLLDALTITPAGVSTLLGNGTQYLGLKAISNAGPTGGSGHPSYVTADFNHDGFLDLAVDSPEGIAILFGNGDGTFQTSRAFAAGKPAMSGATRVFTSSGNVDAVVSTAAQQAQFLRGNGDGTFTYNGSPGNAIPTSTQTGIAALWSVVQTGDFNGDGVQDLALTADGGSNSALGGTLLPTLSCGAPSGLTLLYGNGDGTFQLPVPATAPPSPQASASSPAPFYGVSTVERVGYPTPKLDLLFNRDATAYRNYSFNNSGTSGSAIYGTQTTASLHAHNLVAAGGFNAPAGSIPQLFGIIDQQDGSLLSYPDAQNVYGPGNGDLHVDGSLTTPGQLIAPDISPTFPGMSTALGFRAFPGSAIFADLDGNQVDDLLILYDNLDADRTAPTSSAPNYLYIWFGSGNGKFLASAAHPVNPVRLTLSRNYYQVAVDDLNRDGLPDLILSDGYLVSVQLGKGDGTFGPEKHFLGGQGINTISVGDVNNDGISDLVLANGGAVLTNPVANHETLATNPDVNTGGITVLLNQTPQAAPLIPTSLNLALCVDDPGSLFPCGTPLSNTPLISPVTMYFGQVLDGVAVESATNLTGTITFYDGTRVFCTISANLTGVGPTGNACPTNAGNFHAGNRTVDAVYSGDATHAASTSNSIAVQVFPDITTSAIASSLNPATAGQTVTFTATLSGNFAIPTGTVTFFDGLLQIGTATLDATGNATFTTSTLAVGSHPITVAYAGTPDFNPAPIAILTQVILPPATPPPPPPPPIPGTFTLTVAPTPLTVTVGRTGLLLVTVTANGSFAQPVALTCATTTLESSCDFILATIPAGGGSTTFELHTSAPHDCGDPNHPYFAGSCSPPLASPHSGTTLSTPAAATVLLPTILLFGLSFKQARRRLNALSVLLLLALTGLTTLSGCGVCTDLGTQGGRYTFTITATAQGGPVTETQSQTIPLTVIIP